MWRLTAPPPGLQLNAMKPPVLLCSSMIKRIVWWAAYLGGVGVFLLVASEIFLRFLIPYQQGYFVYPPHAVYRFVGDFANTPGTSGVSRLSPTALACARTTSRPTPGAASLCLAAVRPSMFIYQTKMWTNLLQDKLNAAPGQPKTWSATSRAHPWQPFIICSYSMTRCRRLPRMNLFLNLVGVNHLQMTLRYGNLHALSLADNLNWTFSVKPLTRLRDHFAVYRFYERVKDWWKRSRSSVIYTEYASNAAQWRTCRQRAPKDNLIGLPTLKDGLADYRSNLNKLITAPKLITRR